MFGYVLAVIKNCDRKFLKFDGLAFLILVHITQFLNILFSTKHQLFIKFLIFFILKEKN